MVSRDGFAKVLDFGLAKLTEGRAQDEDASVAPTHTGAHTGAGVVMGTVGYMSPEQVQGKSVDHRSDIFSFGCILYEAVTRKRAFEADTAVDTMHKILHDAPVESHELNPSAPADLRRLVRRCLAKSPDQRLQSMKDLAIELREIADNYESLSTSFSSGSSTSSGSGIAAIGAVPRPAGRRAWLIGGAIVAIRRSRGPGGRNREPHGTSRCQAFGRGTRRRAEDHQHLGSTGDQLGDRLRRRTVSRLFDQPVGDVVGLGPPDLVGERGPGRASPKRSVGGRPILAERGLSSLRRATIRLTQGSAR